MVRLLTERKMKNIVLIPYLLALKDESYVFLLSISWTTYLKLTIDTLTYLFIKLIKCINYDGNG